ncbi:hypothetical protein [Corynebacterium auriscanis]|uniref:hypothetical protein n=1 Tax=Corynebacterium auriscanis TaxID=99807 RepID=UPI0024ADB773|nr:hypothetical protein [Corynebacterium auriscanis]
MSNKAQVLVLFARHNETFEEDFVGVALTREQEKAMGKHVDSDTVTCWTERVTLQGWEGELNECNFPQPVYLLFEDGVVQGQKRKKEDFDPEILGAFASRAGAEVAVDVLRQNQGSLKPRRYYIWELQFGWLAEPYRHSGPPVPKY